MCIRDSDNLDSKLLISLLTDIIDSYRLLWTTRKFESMKKACYAKRDFG